MRRNCLVFAIVLSTGAVHAQTPATHEPPVIVASGEAVVQRAPDRAFVQIGAEGRAAKAPDAQQIAANAMAGVQTALKRFNLPADAIKTIVYTVQPEFDYPNGRQQFRDYLARNVIEVRVDDVTRLGQLIDGAGTSGAAVVSGLRWDLKDRDAIELEALRLAVKDAMDRARAMAAGASATLGSIVRLEEQRSSPPRPLISMAARMESAAAAPTPIEAGEIDVRTAVTLTIAIK
jgi:uncharacterized protein YggE